MGTLPAMPRLLPLVLTGLVAVAGLKTVGLVRHAVADTAPARTVPPAPRPSAATAPASAATPAGAASGPQVFTPPAPAAIAEAPVSDAERAILLDLRRRRTELEAREGQLAAREGIIAAAEQRLAARVDELTGLQSRLEALEASRRDRDEESWRGLVKLYETMKPREAAVIFNDLDRPVLLGVLDRMKEAKAASILAAMQPERARQVTADLVQRRAQANRPADAPRPAEPARAGG